MMAKKAKKKSIKLKKRRKSKSKRVEAYTMGEAAAGRGFPW